MFHSRLSSSDFSAIHVGDDFETLLTTSDSNSMSLSFSFAAAVNPL